MQVLPTSGGWIEVVCGSMFSGKSEELMRRMRRAQIARQKIAVFKPKLDNRYHESRVVSHNGNSIEAYAVDSSSAILQMCKGVDVVGIDEAQFFDEGIVEVALRLADAGHRVVVGALDMDFKREPFGPIPHLLAVAEFVDKLQAICQVCGGPATRTQRLIGGVPAAADDPVIMVGATESYEPRCRQCHEVRKNRPSLDLEESALANALGAEKQHAAV